MADLQVCDEGVYYIWYDMSMLVRVFMTYPFQSTVVSIPSLKKWQLVCLPRIDTLNITAMSSTGASLVYQTAL